MLLILILFVAIAIATIYVNGNATIKKTLDNAVSDMSSPSSSNINSSSNKIPPEPHFEAVFAIAGLLTIAYLILKYE